MIKKHYHSDGTSVYFDDKNETFQIPSGYPTISLINHVDDLTAIQLGAAQILDNIVFKSVDRRSMVLENKKEMGSFKFAKIYLDWPDPEDPVTPEDPEDAGPTALIRAESDTKFEPFGQISGVIYLEDTLDQFAPNTILRRYGRANTTLAVDCFVSNKDDRAAIRKGLVEAFSAEPDDERHGRHVIIKNYYDITAQYSLESINYTGDNPDDAKARLLGINMILSAVIPTVGLVKAPAVYLPNYGVRMQNNDDCLT